MANNAADIQITASLIDDYLLAMDAPVGQNPAGRFVAVQDSTAPTSTALLSVDSSGNLLHFYRDQTSHSGWNTTTVSVPRPSGATGQIARLAAFTQANVTSQATVTNALAYFPLRSTSGNAAVWMQSSAPGNWTTAPLTADAANALSFTYQTDHYTDAAGFQYLYGVSGSFTGGAFFIVWLDQQAGNWDVLYEQPLNQFTPALSTGAAFRLMPGARGGINVLWIDSGVINWQSATITNPGTENAVFSFTGVSGAFNPKLGKLTVDQIVPLPGAARVSDLLVIGGTGTLYLVRGYDQPNPTMTPLTGGENRPAGVQSAGVGVDAAGNLTLLVSETTTQALWILRQDRTQAVQPGFHPWVQLGNTVGAVAVPTVMIGGPELFLVDPNLRVFHMAQNLTDLVWSTRKIAAPTPAGTAPTNIAGTASNLTVVDANQAPIGNALISVSSDQPVTIVVGGLGSNVAFAVEPGTPAQIQADGTGKASIVVHATTLSPPPLTFTVTNADGTTAQRACQGDQVQVKLGETAPPAFVSSVASRLAGNDPSLPVTAAALTSANILNPKFADPSAAISAITSTGQWLLQNPGVDTNTLSLHGVTARHWRIEFPPGGKPQFRMLSEAEARDYVHRAAAAAPGSIGGIFGDVANFFKHAWQEVKSITVSIGDELTVLFNDVEKFVLTTVREAGQVLETIFTVIAQGLADAYEVILDALRWLKQLFEWQDILYTHTVIKAVVNSALTELSSCIELAQQKVKTSFGAVEDKIKATFANIESVFAAGQTFNAFANAAGSSPIGGSGNVLAAQPASAAYSQNGSRANYVHGHVKAFYAGSDGGGNGSTGNINNVVQQNWAGDSLSTFNQNTQEIYDVLKSLSSPQQFFDLVMLGLFEAAEDLVLFVIDAVEDIVLAALEVLEEAIKGLQSLWNQPIDIPVISWLYKNVITGTSTNPGDDLTVLDALSLVFAVPATILYKAVIGNGKAPFSKADADHYAQNGLPWPQFGSWPPAAAPIAGARPSGAPGASPALPVAMGSLAGVACFFGTFLTAGADGLAFSDDPDEGVQLFLSWASVVQSLISQVGGAPWSIFTAGPQRSADDWTVALWAFTWVPVVSDLIFTFATGKLARYTQTLGPVLDTGMGWVMAALAAAVVAEQHGAMPPYTAWDQANALVPQCSRGFKFLILTKDTIAEAIGYPGLVFVDLAVGVGSTVTQIGDATQG